MFNHMDGVMGDLAMKWTQWKEDFYITLKLAWPKVPKENAAATPTTGMLLMSGDILYHFQKVRLFRMWDKGLDINPENETSYTTQYQQSFL